MQVAMKVTTSLNEQELPTSEALVEASQDTEPTPGLFPVADEVPEPQSLRA